MRRASVLFMVLVFSSCVFETPPEEYVVIDHHHGTYVDNHYEYVYVETHDQSQCPSWFYSEDSIYSLSGPPYPHNPLYCSEGTVFCCTWVLHLDGHHCHDEWCHDTWNPECGWFLGFGIEEACY